MNNVQSDAFDSAAPIRITATPVPENYRLAFLPRHFPRYFMQAESAVFLHMSNLCARYTGGYWEFFDLSNGGCYLAPRDGAYALVAPNGFEATVSGDVAGLIASLYAFSHLAFKYQATDVFSERYHQLREFALEHAESEAILAAID